MCFWLTCQCQAHSVTSSLTIGAAGASNVVVTSWTSTRPLCFFNPTNSIISYYICILWILFDFTCSQLLMWDNCIQIWCSFQVMFHDFKASTMKQMRTVLFWAITQQVVGTVRDILRQCISPTFKGQVSQNVDQVLPLLTA
jgi:hypothetical protein